MKLQVTQENFAKALASVARTASSKSTLPILSNVLLKTAGNRLRVAATNLDIGITHNIGSKISQEGSITVPARLTQDFVSSLPGEVIDLELEENKLHISTEKYQSTINGVGAEDFPVMPAISNGSSIKIDALTLKEALSQVIVAASNDEARPVLTGIFMHAHEGNLYFVATDSYRLAERKVMPLKQDVRLLVPSNAMQDLLRVIPDDTETVEIFYDDQQVSFVAGDVELVTRMIDGEYPNYRNLIPAKFEHTATVERSEFINITKVSSLFARESAGSVTLTTDEKAKELSITSVASQVGDNTAAASAKIYGEGAAITLNSRYLLDALNVFHGAETTLSFNSKLDAAQLSDPKNKDYTHIVMPLKS
ncbi:MAG: DNA polymerase III subunit beta [Candidatus Saccharibacteria bacterium]|nr:DNA polymerase III subunit beta [Candidatus Saccharibacteria bacterium]